MAAENYTILNFYGREQPLDVPQFASSASRREQRETETAPGRSLVCDRLRDRVRVMGRAWGRFAVRTLSTCDSALGGVRQAPVIDRCETRECAVGRFMAVWVLCGHVAAYIQYSYV